MARELPAEPARAFILITAAVALVLLMAAVSIAGSYALTLHQISVDHAAHAATTAKTQAASCRQFGNLVESVMKANAETAHAVTPGKSFGELLTEALTRYYGTTGCPKLAP